MKTAASVILVSLAWVGFLAGGSVADELLGDEQIAAPTSSEPAAEVGSASADEPFDPFTGSEAVVEEANPFMPDRVAVEAGPGCDACGEGGDPSVCSVCGEGNCLPGVWYVDQDMRFFTRKIHSKFLPITTVDELGINEFGQQALIPRLKMSSNSENFNVSSGYAVTIGRYLGWGPSGYDAYLEGVYWGLHEWTISSSYSGTILSQTIDGIPVFFGSLNTPFPSTVGGFNRALDHLFTYNSDINNIELNVRVRPRGRADRLVMYPNGAWRRECQPGYFTSCVVGVRSILMNEDFRFRSEGTFQIGEGTAPVSTSGDYFSKTHNSLIGLQFGGELVRRECRWSYGMRGKAGPMINYSDAEIRAVSNAIADPLESTPVNYARTAESTDWSVFAEGGVVGTYKIRPNFSVHAAWDILWIARVATAPLQVRYEIDPPPVIDVRNNQRVWYQGVSLGFEWLR